MYRKKQYNDRQIKIINAAKICLFRNGLFNTSISDIASECNLGEGQIYRCFINKEAILREVFVVMITNKLDSIINTSRSITDTAEKLASVNLSFHAGERELLLEFMAESIRNKSYRQLILGISENFTLNIEGKLKDEFPEMDDIKIKNISEIITMIFQGKIVRSGLRDGQKVNDIIMEGLYKSVLKTLTT